MKLSGETVAIRTLGLARSFDGVSAVAGFDMEVARGEMFGLVGPDGAGKSTAIRLLCGLLKPTSGQGTVLGFDLIREAEKIKGRIGYLSQNFTLYGDLTVDENIEFFADIHGVAHFHQRRDELLRMTGLSPFRKRLSQNLSGGMKKKLALACTLVHQPELIFLDEPSTGVDPLSRGEFSNILNNMVHEGMTVVLTTPYLDEAERCDRIGLVYGGRVVMEATPDEVKARLAGAVYNIQCSDPHAGYRTMRERWPTTHVVLHSGQLRFWTSEGERELQDSVSLLDKRGFGPVTFSRITPSLEDAFIGLVESSTKQGERK